MAIKWGKKNDNKMVKKRPKKTKKTRKRDDKMVMKMATKWR